MVRLVPPARAGIVGTIDTRAVGVAVIDLGGGRTHAGDKIDPAVGFSDLVEIGTAVGPDRPIGLVHAASEAAAERAAFALRMAYRIGDSQPVAEKVVYERIG